MNINNSTSNTVVTGTSAKDSIVNSGANVTIQALGGRDNVTNRGQNAKIDGGDDRDTIENYASNATIDASDGNDTIQNAGSNSTVNGGEGNDSIKNNGYGSKVNVGEGNDSIETDASNVTVEGGKGDDRIDLGDNAKNNLILYNIGDGNDSIYGFNSTSTLDIGDGNSASLIRSGRNIIVKLVENEIVLVGAGNLSKINVRGMKDEVLNVANRKSDTVIVGSSFDDSIVNYYDGTNVTIFGQGGNDTIRNGNNMGYYYSGAKNVTISGGAGKDYISNERYGWYSSVDAGAGNDTIYNKYGYGSTLFGGAGNDSIYNDYSSNKVMVLGGDGNDTIENRDTNKNVTINAGKGNDIIKNSKLVNKVSILGGAGNDTIQNDSARDSTIEGGKGDDFIYDVGDNALINYTAGDGNDLITGFKSDSTLSIAGGIVHDERQNANDIIVTVGDGKITLLSAAKFSNLHIVETPVNINNGDSNKLITATKADDTIINTGDKATISALAGNDSINNNASNVLIDARSGRDKIYNTGKSTTISGGDGYDTISNNAQNSFIDGGSGNDSIFSHGTRVKISGFAGQNTIENYSNSDATSIKGGWHNDSIKNSSSLVTISGNSGKDTIFSSGTSNLINGDTANDIISIEGSYKNTISGGLGDDTINIDWSSNNAVIQYNKGDGRDVINGFNATSTLQLGDGTESYSKSIKGEDVIVNFGNENITLKGAAKLAKLNIAGVTTVNADNSLNGVLISGDLLNDTIENSGNNVTISMFAGNDTVENSGSRVTIDADADNDTIKNSGNNVSIVGGEGSDSINNIEGYNMSIAGGAGDDTISNTDGNFVSIAGDAGADSISNTNGSNVSIVGDDDPDYIFDTNSKNVTIDGGAGEDTISSSGGRRNVINGSNENDSISVINGTNVTVDAGDGNDTITVSGGFRNVIGGGTGDNQIYISPTETEVLIQHSAGNDTVYGFNENSSLQIGDGKTDTYTESIEAGNLFFDTAKGRVELVGAASLPTVNIVGKVKGKDISNNTPNTIINGNAGDDTIQNGRDGEGVTINGNAGDDSIKNESNNVSINGGEGNETIENGRKGEGVTINGNAGDDSIKNESKYVSINCGSGNDTIENYESRATISGGVGDDVIRLSKDSDHAVFRYMVGDGNDTIYGFHAQDDSIYIAAESFTGKWGGRNYRDYVIYVGDEKITIKDYGGYSYRPTIIRDKSSLPLNSNNAKNNVSIVGTAFNDTIRNGGSYVKIFAKDGNDTIENSGNNVSIDASDGNDTITNGGAYVTISAQGGNDTIENNGNNVSIDASDGDDTITNGGFNVKISAGAGKNYILNDAGFSTSILGGEDSDFITVVSSSRVTVNASKGNDQISIKGSDETFIEYNLGDGNDKIYGFDKNSTLDIAKTEFTSAKSGNDLIITVGEDKITLNGAASLSNPNIINGTQATFTVKNGAVTCESDLPENIIKDAYKFNGDSSTLSISSALQNYTVNVKADDAGKVKWHYGTANLNSASTLEYKLDEGKNSVTLTSKNYGDKITIDGDADFNFGQISAEVFKNGTITTKDAKRILFENNSSASVTLPRGYQVDVDSSNIMVNDLPINAKTGAGTVTVERNGMSFNGYGVQFVDLEVAKESYFGKLAPMTVNYNSRDNSYTIQDTACIKTLSTDFTKIKFDFANKGDEKYAYYKVNDVAFLVASEADDINVVETDGTTFNIQDKEINTEKIGRVTLDEQITFSGTEIDFDSVKTTYAHNKSVIYSLDGEEITISDAATVETGDEPKTFKCEAGSYTINGKTFETSADLTFTADMNEIKIQLSDAKTEIYFDGVKVSGVSDGGELVFDLINNKATIPSGANLNITSSNEVNLSLEAGNFTIDGKKLSVNSELEITADKDNIKVPLSSKPVTINGAAITGTDEATIDNTNELFCSVLLPNGAFVQNTSESIYQLSGEGSTASFGGANKKVQLTDNGTTYIEYYKGNTISVGINRFMFETAEIKGTDWTIETSGTSGIDKITGIQDGATVSTSTEYVDAGDLRFEVETSGAGTFNIAGQKVTSSDKDTYVVYGSSDGKIKVALQGEEYDGDDSEAAGTTYKYDKAGNYTVNGITFQAGANTKVRTITRGVEFDLSSGSFQYDGLTLSGGGKAQINRYNAKLVSLTNGAKVSGSDATKYQNRQFEISGTVELIGKKFETNEQIRCGLINVQERIDGQAITLRGFVVDDKYVQIQDNCYESVKVVDKNISSIEGVKNSAEITGNGLKNVSIVTTESGTFKIHEKTYKITDDADGAEFVTDSHGNISAINGLKGSVEGNFASGISINGKAIQITGASSIKVASDGKKITEISNVAGDSVTTSGKTYRQNVRVYELGGAEKLTTSADGTIIFNGNKFEMSAGKTFTLDNAGNISGIEMAQSNSATSAANILETSEEDFATINLLTTSELDEVIGDFSEGLTVNGVLVKVTDSTNFVVKNDDENIYIEANAPDTFTINGKTFTTSADKTIFKLDKSGNVSEIVTDKFYLYPDNETYLIKGDFSDEIIFNGQKFCVTGTNNTTVFIGKETLIGVELARNAVEVVESGDASEIALSGGGDITIGGKTFSTSDDFVGLLRINSLDSFIGTISGELGGVDLAGLTIESDDKFSVTGDGEKVTAIENLQNGTLTSEDLDAITINGEKISLDDADEVTLTIQGGELKTSEESEEPSENPSSEEEILDKLKKENPDYIPVSSKENITLKGGEVAIVEDTSAKASITASKGNDTIVSAGENVSVTFKGGKTEVFALEGTMKISGYNASTGSGFHTDYANIFDAVDEGDIVFNKGRLTIGSAVVIDDSGNNVMNFFDTTGDLQKVGRAFTDTALNLSKETADLVLYADEDSTLTAGAGSDSIFAFEGSKVDAGAGKNYIYIEERGTNSDGVTILLNGKNTVANFNASFDGDKISLGAATYDFSFDGENVSVKSGEARALLQNISSDDDAARILTIINGKEIKTAIAQENLIIAAGDDTADVYYGKKSGVDFTGYSDSLTVDLNENFYGINQVTLGGGQNTLLSSSQNETLTSSDGSTEFIFSKDSGRDVIKNFNFDADKINVGNETITAVNVNNSGGVRMEISGSATLTLEDAQGKNFKVNNFVALVDKNITYNAEANYFVATSQNASLTVGESAEIWLDGSHGKTFVGDIRTLDALTAEGNTSLVGNALDNTILAGNGDSSLWGGNAGNDFMQGGAGKNTFFYTIGNGSDSIAGANNGDVVYLSQVTLEQIASTNITADAVTLNFKDGGSLQVNSNADITYQLADGSKFSANHAQAVWLLKSTTT